MIALGTFFKYLSLIGSFTAIGTLLAMAFLLLDVEGKFSIQGYKLKRLLWGAAIVWSFGVAGTIIVTLATALDQPYCAHLLLRLRSDSTCSLN
jgi:hypothetical protein